MLGSILLDPVELTLILLDTDEVSPKLFVGYPLPVTLVSNFPDAVDEGVVEGASVVGY